MTEFTSRGAKRYNLHSLLAGDERDFLVCNHGHRVEINSINTRIIALYFSSFSFASRKSFDLQLVQTYYELFSEGKDFEVVLVSADDDENSFNKNLGKLPWLAVPYSDRTSRRRLLSLFEVTETPCLVIFDGSGKVLTDEGVDAVKYHGAEGYPFTPEKFKQLKEQEEAAKKKQTLQRLLVSGARDFLVSNKGIKVHVSDLEGKIVGLLFSKSSCGSCSDFTTTAAVDMYRSLKRKGENFEMVLVSLDEEELSFQLSFTSMPWLAIPFRDNRIDKLSYYFGIEAVPTLVIIGSDGKTLNADAYELVKDLGAKAFPFSPGKMKELAKKEEARREAQTLESLLASENLKFVIGNGGLKVRVSKLVGMTILLFFSASWVTQCPAALPSLVEAYQEMKRMDRPLEVIFVSSDKDQTSFDDYYSYMPWLALPFGDPRIKSLIRRLKISEMPTIVAIDPSGRTAIEQARGLVLAFGPYAYPFTEERVMELVAEMDERAKQLPTTVRHSLHQHHLLWLTQRNDYICDGCEQDGLRWSFYCQMCDFDLHPQCACQN